MNYLLASGEIGVWLDKTFQGFDLSVFSFFGKMGNDVLNIFARFFSNFGDTKYGIGLILLAIVLVFFRKTRKYGLTLIFAIGLGLLVTNLAIKPFVARVRPYNTLQYIPEYFSWYTNAGMLAESDYCFPSGHTTASFAVFISMFLCFSADKKKKIAWIFPVLAVLTGLSRIYLMVHYATDVIAAVIIGVLAGIIGYNISRVITKKYSGSYGWHKYDLERIIREKTGKRISRRFALSTITIVWLVIVAISLIFMLKAGGDTLRCAYDGEYKCYNEVKQKDKYLIDGEYYCKIHTKELTQE